MQRISPQVRGSICTESLTPEQAHTALVDAGFTPARAGVDLEDPRPANTVDYRTSWDTYGAFATDRKELGVLDYNEVPAVLVETHYMNNASEVAAFQTPAAIASFSAAVELGVLNYLHAPDGPKQLDAVAPEGAHWTVQVLATTAQADAEAAATALRAARFDDVVVTAHADEEQRETH